MSDLAAAGCSITTTERRHFFWAAWWSAAPRVAPFQRPDASGGGAATFDEARAAAERAAGRSLSLLDPAWAKAWKRVLRGREPWPSQSTQPGQRRVVAARAGGATPEPSIWDRLGVAPGTDETALRQAFRARALVLHPDHGGAPDEFRALVAAYAEARRRARRPRRRGEP